MRRQRIEGAGLMGNSRSSLPHTRHDENEPGGCRHAAKVILILMRATPLAEAAEFGGFYSVYPEREVLLG